MATSTKNNKWRTFKVLQYKSNHGWFDAMSVEGTDDTELREYNLKNRPGVPERIIARRVANDGLIPVVSRGKVHHYVNG